MSRLALILAFGLGLAGLCPQSGLAQPADDLDAVTAEAAEHEALATALDELGLEFGGSGLENLDNGELWQVIEKERRRRAATGEMLEKYSKPM